MYLDIGWMWGGVAHSQKTASKWVHYLSQTQTIEQLGTRHQAFLGSEGCMEGMCHSSTHSPNVQVCHCMISLTRPSPTLVQRTTNAGVRRPGYEATVYPLYHSCLKFTRLPLPSLEGMSLQINSMWWEFLNITVWSHRRWKCWSVL